MPTWLCSLMFCEQSYKLRQTVCALLKQLCFESPLTAMGVCFGLQCGCATVLTSLSADGLGPSSFAAALGSYFAELLSAGHVSFSCLGAGIKLLLVCW